MSAFPTWLRTHLTATGHWNTDGIGRRARYGRCPDCSAPVLAGLDGPIAARTVIADPHEIDELGEFIALTAGLRTSHLTTSGGEWFIDPRWQESIRAGRTRPVIADHRCGFTIPPATTPLLTEHIHVALPDAPPF